MGKGIKLKRKRMRATILPQADKAITLNYRKIRNYFKKLPGLEISQEKKCSTTTILLFIRKYTSTQLYDISY